VGVRGSKVRRPPVALAEQGHFWVGVERVVDEQGTHASGGQMFVEFRIPAELRHELPVVLVHGGGGQGLDYLGRLDGGPGWAELLTAAGFAVYVVDRPGLGRSPFYPPLLGRMTPTPTYEMVASMFARSADAAAGGIDRSIDATMASSGPSMADLGRSHELWRVRGAELLDRIGPAVLFTHSMGGSFGWLVADERPALVRAVVAVEPVGPAFTSFGPGADLTWGLTASPVAYEPPVADPSELEKVEVSSARVPYLLQAEPARRLANLGAVPILVVSTDEPFFADRDPATVAFLAQAGCDATELCLRDHGIGGSRHFVMLSDLAERALEPILDWLDRRSVTSGAPPEPAPEEPGEDAVQLPAALTSTYERLGIPEAQRKYRAGVTAPALAESGHFWVGVAPLAIEPGTVAHGQMFVRYLVPAAVTRPYPAVLVHGDGMQGLAFFGPGGGEPGWVHRFLADGYATYVLDRPGQGRPPLDPAVLGEMAPPPSLERIARMHPPAAGGGIAGVERDAVDQLLAQLGPSIADPSSRRELDRTRGAELLDRIGPAVLVTHASGAELAWLAACERPELVKAIVAVAPGGWPGEAFPPLAPASEVRIDVEPPGTAVSVVGRIADAVAPLGVLGLAPTDPTEHLVGIPIALIGGDARLPSSEDELVASALRRTGAPVWQMRVSGLGMRAASPFALVGDRRDDMLGPVLEWLAEQLR